MTGEQGKMGAFRLGWWNIIFFCCLKGFFSELWGCCEWDRGGCHPRLLAVLSWDAAEKSPKSNHPHPHHSALSWDLAMLVSSPSASRISGNGKEFHSLVYPLIPFEFWCCLPLLATPLGVFWEILIQTLLEMYTLAFLLLPQPNKSPDIFSAPFEKGSLSLWTGAPVPSVTVGAPKQEHEGSDNQIPQINHSHCALWVMAKAGKSTSLLKLGLMVCVQPGLLYIWMFGIQYLPYISFETRYFIIIIFF